MRKLKRRAVSASIGSSILPPCRPASSGRRALAYTIALTKPGSHAHGDGRSQQLPMKLTQNRWRRPNEGTSDSTRGPKATETEGMPQKPWFPEAPSFRLLLKGILIHSQSQSMHFRVSFGPLSIPSILTPSGRTARCYLPWHVPPHRQRSPPQRTRSHTWAPEVI